MVSERTHTMRHDDRRFQIARSFERGMHLRSLRTRAAAGTVLYVHGLGESALGFERLMSDPRLAGWDHLAPDLIGYGKSAWGEEPLTLDEHAEQLDRLLGRFHWDPVVVLGHSMGGVIGTRFCERFGDQVRAFISVEGNISLPDCGYSGRGVNYSAEEWLTRGFAEVLDVVYEGHGERTEVRRLYAASMQMCDPRAYHLNSHELVEVSKGEKQAGCVAALGMPSIYVHGAPRGSCEESLELLAAAEVKTVQIEEAGHWPFLDQHDGFVEQIRDFLDKVRCL